MTFVLALIAAVSLTACATNPVTGKRELSFMSEAQEIAVGREADAQVRQEMGLYEDDDLQRYVQELGMRLAQRSQRLNLPWSFAVLDSPAVNAFALPGGFIYITRGILPYLDNEARMGSRSGARGPDDTRADCGDDGSQRRAELADDAFAAG